MNENSIKVVIVDDHPVVRKGIESFIEDEDDISIVGEAANTADAIGVIENIRPDIAVVDISLDDSSSGLDLLKVLKERFPEIRVLVLSMYDEMIYAERAFNLGARGYLQKNKGPKMIVDAIKEIMAGGTFFTHTFNSSIPGLSDRPLDDREVCIIRELTNRELEVFQLFGEGFETNDIAKKLNLSKHTIDSHRKNIKEKLKLSKNNELVMIAAQWVLNNMKKVY
jgi:DNA-binding NarL/FixJ family response regulator